jgi:hypothetical protein
MFNLFSKKCVIQVSIEYRAPHFMILVRNPGQKTWEPVRSKTRKVSVQDEFGAVVKIYPAIEAFTTQDEAEQWVTANISQEHERKPRTKSEFMAWTKGEKDSAEKYQYTAA